MRVSLSHGTLVEEEVAELGSVDLYTASRLHTGEPPFFYGAPLNNPKPLSSLREGLLGAIVVKHVVNTPHYKHIRWWSLGKRTGCFTNVAYPNGASGHHTSTILHCHDNN